MDDFIPTGSNFFSVKKVLTETTLYCIENKSSIFDELKYPGIAILAISLIPFGNELGITYWFLLVSSAYFYNVFTINCHRLILLNEKSESFTELMAWNKRNTNFLLTTFGLAVGLAVFIIPISFIFLSVANGEDSDANMLSIYIAMIPFGYIFSRLSLILPAIAIDKECNFHQVWKISSGNGWKLFFIVSIIPMATGYILKSINSDYILFKFLSSLLGILILIFEIMVLSNSYKQLNQIYEKPNALSADA